MFMPSRSSFYLNTTIVFLYGNKLAFVHNYKYLGTIVTYDATDDANMSRQRGICYARSIDICLRCLWLVITASLRISLRALLL